MKLKRKTLRDPYPYTTLVNIVQLYSKQIMVTLIAKKIISCRIVVKYNLLLYDANFEKIVIKLKLIL